MVCKVSVTVSLLPTTCLPTMSPFHNIMRRSILLVLLVELLHIFPAEAVLECYTGYSLMKGGTIGSETKKCGKETDFCYNATAHFESYTTLQKAGCNSLLCQFNENKCFDETIAGKPVTFCCCNNEDRCNGGKMVAGGSFMERGLAMAKGIASFLGK